MPLLFSHPDAFTVMLLPLLPASHAKSMVPPAVGAHRGKYSTQIVLSFTWSQRSSRTHGGGAVAPPKVTVACALLPCSGRDSLQSGESPPQLSCRCGAGLRFAATATCTSSRSSDDGIEGRTAKECT